MDHDIMDLIKKGEGETVEFKEQIPKTVELAKVLVALANKEGGTVLIGVSDNGTVVGTSFNDKMNRLISDVASNNCEPPIRIETELVEIDGKGVLLIHVPRSNELHSAKGQFYIKTGSSKQRLTTREIRTSSRSPYQ